MSKIKTMASLLSTNVRKANKTLLFKNKYFNRLSKTQFDQIFAKQEPSHKQLNSFLGKQSADQLTLSALSQYELKLKQIRQEHTIMQKTIKQKYAQILKTSASKNKLSIQKLDQEGQEIDPEQQLVQQVREQRLNQIMDNQQIQKNKIQKLTNQYRVKFGQARKQYELQYIKKYMLENVGSLQTQNQMNPQKFTQTLRKIANDQDNSFIPNQLVLKKLAFKTTDGKTKQILLAGIQDKDQNHCLYLKKLIEKLKIKNVLTMMPPDLPYFIKTQNSFLQEWRQFLRKPSPTFKFYLNPNPKTLDDIKLVKNYIPLAISGMNKSKSFYQTAYSMMQLNEVNFKYQHQPLYSGLVSNTVQNVYFCDYPFLKERQMIALSVKLEDLRSLMKRYTYYKLEKKQNFSAQLLLPKNVVEKKFRHIIKLAKTVALGSQTPPILICDASIAQVLSQQWKKSPLQFLQFDYNLNTYHLDLQFTKIPETQVMFIQFIQKLVILDIILKPLIQNYFVKYQSFPYSCRNTVGGKQNLTKVFLVWKHYHDLYSSAVKGNFDRRQKRGQYV